MPTAAAPAPEIRRIVAIGDPHCGQRSGLTPRQWHGAMTGGKPGQKLRREMWRWYCDACDAVQPVYAVILNGDAIDGRGERSGGTELITTDRNEQVDMAVQCVCRLRPQHGVYLTHGTPYHTGDAEDWEAVLADRLRAQGLYVELSDMLDLDVSGCIINAKHHVGSSSVPHGRHTAIAKERLWNVLWGERDDFPRANIILRSHVHYHVMAGEPGAGWLAMTLPALQAAGTKYGARRCNGTVDFGMVSFDIDSNGGYTWSSTVKRLKSERRHLSKL